MEPVFDEFEGNDQTRPILVRIMSLRTLAAPCSTDGDVIRTSLLWSMPSIIQSPTRRHSQGHSGLVTLISPIFLVLYEQEGALWPDGVEENVGNSGKVRLDLDSAVGFPPGMYIAHLNYFKDVSHAIYIALQAHAAPRFMRSTLSPSLNTLDLSVTTDAAAVYMESTSTLNTTAAWTLPAELTLPSFLSCELAINLLSTQATLGFMSVNNNLAARRLNQVNSCLALCGKFTPDDARLGRVLACLKTIVVNNTGIQDISGVLPEVLQDDAVAVLHGLDAHLQKNPNPVNFVFIQKPTGPLYTSIALPAFDVANSNRASSAKKRKAKHVYLFTMFSHTQVNDGLL
ncbi:hypothetical protein BDZ89DRAFT_1129204 [Hymenopellis radicata]|nr:hypothetical protein BDZ89DRAFT_1129204 [Hymenopellis radicata]